MSLSFDPDTIPLPVGHFIGGELIAAEGAIEMRRPSDGRAYAACPVADATWSTVRWKPPRRR